MKQVEIYTDGSCRRNPGPGGWGAVLVYGGREMEICGGEAATTNNRMELTAAIEALSALKEPCRVTLTSDSKYLTDAITKGWVYSWKKKGWKKSDGKAVLNPDLWEKPPRPSRCHVRVGEGARRTSVQRAVRRNGAERIRKVRRMT